MRGKGEILIEIVRTIFFVAHFTFGCTSGGKFHASTTWCCWAEWSLNDAIVGVLWFHRVRKFSVARLVTDMLKIITSIQRLVLFVFCLSCCTAFHQNGLTHKFVLHTNRSIKMNRIRSLKRSSNLISMARHSTSTEVEIEHELETERELDFKLQPPLQKNTQPLKNLRGAGNTVIRENSVLQSWNEFKGLSERELLTAPALSGDLTTIHSDVSSSSISNSNDALHTSSREQRALSLAYRRCEYVTKLFSKTFYMGTSLMEPAARKHVWAIYAWCRRTGEEGGVGFCGWWHLLLFYVHSKMVGGAVYHGEQYVTVIYLAYNLAII